jgi:uncharacterized RDD family membrane protein YckC
MQGNPEQSIEFDRDEFISEIIIPASWQRRLVNIIIDLFVIRLAIVNITGITLGVLSSVTGLTWIASPTSFILAILLAIIIYYIVSEYFSGKTLGKLISGTRVVMEDGSKPGFKTILVRSLARLIPFEVFSFFGQYPQGIHDTVSETIVIRDIDLYRIKEKSKQEEEEQF